MKILVLGGADAMGMVTARDLTVLPPETAIKPKAIITELSKRE